jgi:hypothetical protein
MFGGMSAYNPPVQSKPLGIDPTHEVIHNSMYSFFRVNLSRQLIMQVVEP